MKFARLLAHLFIPHESNNQKAKILHSQSLGLIAVFLIGLQLLLGAVSRTFPRVLGYAANIAPSEVIRLTNEKRAQNSLNPLTENSILDSAALAKGNDMLAKGYWAHFAPDGTSPWTFFVNFGYRYKYAGENLARDFSSAPSAIEAWMNSPTHRENILNPNYKEIGIGVVEGSLLGADTTIIVQFFGTSLSGSPSVPIAKAGEAVAIKAVSIAPMPVIASPTPSPTPVAKIMSPAITSPFNLTKSVSLAITGGLLLILSIDLIIVRRKRIARIGGRTLAHLAFFGMILAVIIILKAGQII
jgi:hypothetical protein